MEARITHLAEKKLVGKHCTMQFANHNPYELWKSFMPLKKTILNTVGTDLYSLEVYPESFFENFSMQNSFEKWAAIEVSNFDDIPESLDTLIIPSGKYAVFTHVGLQSEAVKTYNFIFTEWLPKSEYQLDQRPHFAVMGEKYKMNDPYSEEEIWIPIKAH